MFEKIDPKAKKIVYLQAFLGIFVALCVGLIVTVLVMSRGMSTTASYTSLASSMQFASSTMSSTSPDTHIDGSFHFYAEDGSVRIVGNLRGLAPNSEHGVYVIEFGDIMRKSGSGFLNDALHFNPDAHTHGCPSSKEKHAGDLGNIKTDDQGVSTFDLRASWLQLPQIVGRAIVIGNTKDDCKPTFKTDYIASGAIALSKSLEPPVESKATVAGASETDSNPADPLAASTVSQPLQAPDSESLSSVPSPPFAGSLAAAAQITPEPAFSTDSLATAFKPSSIPDLSSAESELTRDMNRSPTSSKSKRRKSVQDNVVSAPPPDPSSAILTSQLEPEPESRPIPALGMEDMSKLSTFGEEEEKAQQKLLQELNEKQKKMEEDQRHEADRRREEERRRKQQEEDESKRIAQEEMQLKADEDKRKQEEKMKQQDEEEKKRKAEEEAAEAAEAALVKQQAKDTEEEQNRKNKAVQTAKDKLEHDPNLAKEVEQGETSSRNKKKKHRRKHSRFEDFDPFGPPDSSPDSTTDSTLNQQISTKPIPSQAVPTSPAPADATLSFPFLGGQSFGGPDDNPFQKLLQSLQQPQNNKVAPFSPEASTVMPRFLTNQVQDEPFAMPFQQSAPPLPETEEQLTDPDDVGSKGSNTVDPLTALLGSGIRRTDST
eukprot:GILK01001185.1.p1 GENE.GILK01001185.1~~GILK01001185.1.p1  ORF type:complete len:658 (+),score=162.34 GILK01001185.1:140-2113(+)